MRQNIKIIINILLLLTFKDKNVITAEYIKAGYGYSSISKIEIGISFLKFNQRIYSLFIYLYY